jgi:hypothetical protein
MSTTAQRKAWNEAMRSAAGLNALPAALQPNNKKRRSDRKKKQDRRDKARKMSAIGSGAESKEFMAAAWMDALEDVAAAGPAGEDDDSYDELDELQDNDGGSGKKRRQQGKGSKKQSNAGLMPKRFKPRSLASILLEEVNRDDGAAYTWLEAEARALKRQRREGAASAAEGETRIATTVQQQPPARKFCPVTGMGGIYTDPKSGIPFANLKALDQIRERPPPWMTLGGSIAYHEAVKSIRDET